MLDDSPFYFRNFGTKAVLLAAGLAGVLLLGAALGVIHLLAASCFPPLATVGVTMMVLPGTAKDDGSFEAAWTKTGALTKLVWLLGFSVGVVVMLALIFFAIAPNST